MGLTATAMGIRHRSILLGRPDKMTEAPIIGGWVFGSPVTERPYQRNSLARAFLTLAGWKIGLAVWAGTTSATPRASFGIWGFRSRFNRS